MINEINKAYQKYDYFELLEDGNKLILYFWNGDYDLEHATNNIFFELTPDFEEEYDNQ